MKNCTQLKNEAARDLAWFKESERTLENAKICLTKVLAANTGNPEAEYIKNNFDFFVGRVLTASNEF